MSRHSTARGEGTPAPPIPRVSHAPLTLFLILYFCFRLVRPDFPFFLTMAAAGDRLWPNTYEALLSVVVVGQHRAAAAATTSVSVCFGSGQRARPAKTCLYSVNYRDIARHEAHDTEYPKGSVGAHLSTMRCLGCGPPRLPLARPKNAGG